MASGQDSQLGKALDEVLKTGDVQALDVFLQRDIYEGTPIKCSQQFLTKLDKLVSRSLDQQDSKSASLGLAVLYKCGKNLKLPGGCQGLSGIIAQGLLKKMVQWFEKCRQLWTRCGLQWDETLFNLSEDFFDALMVVHEACNEGAYKTTEAFLYPVGQLAVDPRIYILIRKEAIRKFNLILDKIPVELKKKRKILTSQEASDIMIKLAGQITEGGDYDLQTALMEALCRMATPDQRKELADRWFSMEHVANAFVKIHDSEFETDCRKFLNLVNGMQGDRRRVYSYPCLEVYLDKYELLMPADEKLEEFWIDFNLGSHSISFYFSLADEEVQESQWETICINENEVQSYTVTEEGKRQVLQLKLSEVVVVGAVEGSSLTIHFSSSLDILQVARSVYGHSKNKGFVGKTGTSVVKTTVKIIMEESSSQVVPESQLSLGESEKNTAPYLLPAPSAPMVTPAKRRISESTLLINSSAGSVHGASSLSVVVPSNTPVKGRGKPSLEMVPSCDRQGVFYLGEQRTSANISSHGTTPNSLIAGGMIEQNISLAKTVDLVLAGKAGEQSLEQNFVPDTQPRTEKNTSSHWNKLSVSEMLMMPTQKINYLPRPGSCSSLAQQERLSVTQRWSVPVLGPISQKQQHMELTQRLQQVLSERNQDPPPQEPAAPQRKMSNVREDPKGRSSADRCASTLGTPKEKQPQRNGQARGRSKGQMSLKADAALIKASAKASTSKALLERITPNFKVETNMALSSKQKREAAVAGSMVKLISSRYEIKTQSSAKDNEENIPPSRIPFVNKVTYLELKAKRSPTAKLKLQKALRGRVLQEKRYVKKHLFSDTDTDYAMTEVSWLRESNRKPKPKVTKYSRQAPNKPRDVSHHTSYESSDLSPSSRKPVKGNAKHSKKKPDVKERVEQPKKTVKPAAPNRPQIAGRRPQRAAASSTKSYKEPDTEDSQSESEMAPVSKKYLVGQQGKSEKTRSEVPEVKKQKKIPPEQSSDTYKRLGSNNQSDLKKPSGLKQQRPENILPETSKSNKKNVAPAQEWMNTLKDSWAAHHSFCPSPPFIEGMRSAERSAPTLGLTCSPLLSPRGSPLPASPDPPCQNTPSPILLLPKPQSTVSRKGLFQPTSFYSAEKKRSSSKTRSIQSVPSLHSLTPIGQNPAPSVPTGPKAAEISPIQEHLHSPPRSPLSLSAQPLLTSTLLELDQPSVSSHSQSPFPEDSHGCHYVFSKVSSVSMSQSSTKSSVLTSRVKDSSTAASHKTEKTPPPDRELSPAQLHISGPSRKRHISSSSNSEEDEKEERKKRKMRGPRSPRMKPRKLFKSFAEVSVESEVSRVMSSTHTVSSSHWEAEGGDGDVDMDEDLELPKIAVTPGNLCQQFSCELKKKFQNRYKMMEAYNKQSLKTVQQHVSSLDIKMTKYRTQSLKQVEEVLLEEIHKLEQDDTVLKSMEKDLTMYWKKQTMAFRSYQEQETRRNETLTNALQSNVRHSLEYEERIFTSQMCLIRKDMKSVQDRLLSQMQEGEVQSVKRGLHALFFPDGGFQ
ncbi:synaptonemal complex protein 2 [Pempheris klunzingeri]|uniref:synaptonemal complex protein 2 n=1 Tax=Pempheris klunzingeri TaxID=3127111 RepID=UPI003980472D